MKNTKELQSILAVLFYLNRLGKKDKDIENVLDYAFNRILEQNTNMLVLACIGRTKKDAYPEIMEILKQDTDFHNFMAKKELRKKQYNKENKNG